MNFANFIPAILGILGLSAFNKVEGKDGLTDEECATLKEYGFSDRFLSDFKAYIQNPQPSAGNQSTDDTRAAAVAAVLGQVTSQHQEATAQLDSLKKQVAKDKAAHEAAIASKEAEIEALNEKIKTLSALPENDPGKGAGFVAVPASAFNLDDTQQLGGLPGAYFALDRPYNLRAKAALLANEGKMLAVAVPNSVDYKTLQEDLGAFYRTHWSDRLQSFLVELPTITKIFKTESGHQDLETLTNLFLGEFSQPDNSANSEFDKVTKGTYEFGHETLRMYGVMFAHKFQSLKDLEKSWIGYLNSEGSNPVKLSFIEFLLVETAKVLHNEREQRYINGVRKDPDPNVPGRAMEAADGIYEYIRKRVEGHTDFTPNGGTTGKTVYQIKPFVLPKITAANIGEVFYQGTGMIPSKFRDTGKICLYIPSWMLPLYHKYNEAHYGQNVDYKAGITYVKEFPAVRIVTLPNADNHHRIFWTVDGNIKTFDHVPGEMLRFTLEQQDWTVKVWSNWKESIQATAVGYKYTDPLAMDGSRQLIWCNDYDRPDTYFIEAARDANPSALLHSSIVTVANSKQFEITDIADAQVGRLISLKCGVDGDNGITIKKNEKFSLLTAAWTPSKGDIITLMKRADGKFIEISRSTAAAESYQFDANATTPSLKGATVFITGENTAATAITNLTDGVPGTLYTIHGAGDANASTIPNSGNFVLTKDIILKAGTFIKLVKGDDNKFYEVARG
nr:MAG TPA: major capsid protein [Caudoviricetes sp.]